MARCHITRFAGPPTTAPLASGDHYVDTTNGNTYLSVGTAGVADWILVDAGAIAAIQAEQATQNTAIGAAAGVAAGAAAAAGNNATDISTNATNLQNHTTDTTNPHSTNLLNLSDVSTNSYAGGNRFFKLRSNAAGDAVELFETYEASAFRITPLLHQPATFEQYLTLNAVIPVAGDYLLMMSHRFSLNAVNVNFESHVLFGTQFLMPTHVEPKDAFGAGIVVPDSAGGTTNTGTDNFDTRSGLYSLTLPVGPATFTLEFRGQTANQEATVYEAELYLKRKEV